MEASVAATESEKAASGAVKKANENRHPACAHKVVFVRHGESTWNKENRFTGWHDVPLSDHGIQEAVEAGKMLKEQGYEFDQCFTSVLQRSKKTWDVIAE